MVADSFLDAVETFASTVGNGNLSGAAQRQHQYLNYIQLVANERHYVVELIQCFKQRLGAQ